ncbi:Acyl-CoA-binding domain-containing protein 2 [Leucoagaricus sp. SymC.cos]|nr:Acyl-CoA-binding domain-containing protein 2 [Leucoagaricus sp. SymC.cos]
MPSSQFDAAATYLTSGPSLSKVSNTTKLELYGLFKTVTVGSTPTTSRPSIFDITGRAKWDAWNAAGKKYSDVHEAESRYLEIAKGLGWDETQRPLLTKSGKGKGKGGSIEGEEGDIWDSEDDSSAPQKSSGGLGLSVSTMARTEETSEQTLHGFAVDNDAKGLEDLLAVAPDLNLNELDEFGYTPLHLAADRGHLDIVKFLLSKGAERSIKDSDDMTALDLARIVGHHEIVSVLSE